MSRYKCWSRVVRSYTASVLVHKFKSSIVGEQSAGDTIKYSEWKIRIRMYQRVYYHSLFRVDQPFPIGLIQN